MKIKIFFLFMISMFSSFVAHANADPQLKCVRGCANYGFFVEFSWVLNHLEWCEATNQIPVVYWGPRFAYYSSKGHNGSLFNAWEYYFEPVSELSYEPTDIVRTDCFYHNFTTTWWYAQMIHHKYLLTDEELKSMKALPLPAGMCGDSSINHELYPTPAHPYNTAFRHRVKQLIDKYIVIKPCIQEKINEFYTTHMKNHKVVGLHLRGTFLLNEVGQVPIEIICEEANNVADENTIFFVATDQNPLLNQARKLLKGKVVAYDCYRQDITTSPLAPGQWPPKMGEDVLIETMLLSRCDYLVHTLSSVSTVALYFNPDLPHLSLYCDGTPPN